jgi:hypothetical protein
MGSFFSKTKTPKTTRENFVSAGCIFTNKTHILAGYQPNKKTPYISGFGGKRIGDEDFRITAMRETLEELFDMKDIPIDLINHINDQIVPIKVIINGTHINLVMSFHHIIDILRYLRDYGINTCMYSNRFPYTISELIFERKANKTSEIKHLCILPVDTILPVDPLFVEDLNLLLK